jgi:hypothetical protein
MYSVKLEWHPYSIDLKAVQTYITANFPTCLGSSADYNYTLWFSEELTDEEKSDIQAYWDGILVDSTEATSYVSLQQITDRIDELKTGLIAKAWDDMTAAERKIVVGAAVSNAELGF